VAKSATHVAVVPVGTEEFAKVRVRHDGQSSAIRSQQPVRSDQARLGSRSAATKRVAPGPSISAIVAVAPDCKLDDTTVMYAVGARGGPVWGDGAAERGGCYNQRAGWRARTYRKPWRVRK